MKSKLLLIAVVAMTLLGGARASENFPVESRAQWQAAAEQGDAEAQFKLGKSYCCGYGASYNTAKALYWLCKAGKQGHVGAIYEMGRQLDQVTDRGRPFTDQHFILEAYVWYSQAVDLGSHPLAELYRRKLAADFTPGQMEIVKARLSDWSNSDCDRYTGRQVWWSKEKK